MTLPKPTLQINVDYDGWHWRLAFDGTHQSERGLWLICSAHFSRDEVTVVAKITEPSQIDALMDRVQDDADNAYDLSREIVDLLLTLATTRLKPDCLTYMIFQLCLWISENRRTLQEEVRAA
jgi:hypothetical protein